MIDAQLYIRKYEFLLPELPKKEVDEQREKMDAELAVLSVGIPAKVLTFIIAVGEKMGTKGRIGVDKVMVIGKELRLSMDSFKGQKIDDWTLYPVEVPKLAYVNHALALARKYRKQSREGVEQYLAGHINNTKQRERLLAIWREQVYGESREEVKSLLNQWSNDL